MPSFDLELAAAWQTDIIHYEHSTIGLRCISGYGQSKEDFILYFEINA
jgi:hypothetical protein